MSITTTALLETSARRLFPTKTLDQALAELLLERAQKNLIKYQTMTRHFEAKHKQSFDVFRQHILESRPPFELEQDYFEWEMAVSGVTDMQKEVERLRGLEGRE